MASAVEAVGIVEVGCCKGLLPFTTAQGCNIWQVDIEGVDLQVPSGTSNETVRSVQTPFGADAVRCRRRSVQTPFGADAVRV